MSITEYITDFKPIDSKEFKIGTLYFFEKFLVSELNEGAHINFENSIAPTKAIKNFYKNQTFGLIANRINSYSINVHDTHKWNSIFPNLKAYAVVGNKLFSKGVFELENRFFEYNREIFKNLEDAIHWVEETLETVS